MISHSHKTVFVHIPKCGGQSVETSFLTDVGLTWGTRAPFLLRQNRSEKLGPPRLGHLLAREYAQFHYLSQELFEAYYSFAIVRDPVSRAVSFFNYLHEDDPDIGPDAFEPFLYKWLPERLDRGHTIKYGRHDHKDMYWFVRPQADYVTDLDGNVIVRDLFRLEDIATAFPIIQARSHLKSELKHVNKSAQRVKKSDVSDADIAHINDLYRVDVDLLSAL